MPGSGERALIRCDCWRAALGFLRAVTWLHAGPEEGGKQCGFPKLELPMPLVALNALAHQMLPLTPTHLAALFPK